MSKEYSVLMSVYKKENPEYFRESIKSMMEQTLPFSEFVLMVDGPVTEELEQVIGWAKECIGESFRVVRLEKNVGLGKALQIGVEACSCPVIARMDSDDISRFDRCEKQMQILKDGGYGIVGTGLQEFEAVPGDTSNCRILPQTDSEIRSFMKQRNPFNHPSVMYRREDVLLAGNYKEFQGFEDYYLWVRMLQNGSRGYNLQEVLLDMRTGNGMYARRGGWEYLKTVIAFQIFLKKTGVTGSFLFLKNTAVRIMVSLISNEMRKKFYKIFLRKKK